MVGNQRLAPNWWSNRTDDRLISPVSATELANWLGILEPSPEDIIVLDGLLDTASQIFISKCSHELRERNYTYCIDRWPERQQPYTGLGFNPSLREWWIDLPMYPVTDVASVEANGELLDPSLWVIDTESRPARLIIKSWSVTLCDLYGIKIIYTAGYAAVASIPPQIKQGILMLSAYLYEHRGACDVGVAAAASGASSVWGTECLLMGGL